MKRRSFLAMLGFGPVTAAAAVVSDSSAVAASGPAEATEAPVDAMFIYEDGTITINAAQIRPEIERAIREYDHQRERRLVSDIRNLRRRGFNT